VIWKNPFEDVDLDIPIHGYMQMMAGKETEVEYTLEKGEALPGGGSKYNIAVKVDASMAKGAFGTALTPECFPRAAVSHGDANAGNACAHVLAIWSVDYI